MKKKQFIYIGFLGLAAVFASCKKDEIFATKQTAAGDIIFSVPDAALTSAGIQPQLTQPDINIAAGRFATTDDVKVTVGLTGGLTELTVTALSTATGATATKATFTGVSGQVDFIANATTLGVTSAAPAAGSANVLQFTATSADKTKSAVRLFTVNLVDPFVLTATNPTTANGDSTITLAFSVPASTTLANLTKVEYFAKRGKNNAETSLGSKTFSATTAADNFKPKMPANPTAATDTMYYRFVATYATGKTVTKSTTVRFVPVSLGRSVTGATIINPAATGADTTRVGYSFAFGAPKQTRKVADPDAKDDLVLVVSGNSDIGFMSGAGNGSRFVKTTTANFTTPTYEAISAAFLAGTPTTSVAAVFVGDVYIVEISRNTGKPASAKYGIFRVTAINATPAADTKDLVTFDFKYK